VIHGDWIDATQDADAIDERIATILKSSPTPHAESPSIFDSEDIPDACVASVSGESIAKVGAFVHEHGEPGLEIANHYGDLEQAIEAMGDHFAGVYDSISDYAEDVTDLSEVPEHLRGYVDMQSIARDMECGGGIFALRISSGTAVFRTY